RQVAVITSLSASVQTTYYWSINLTDGYNWTNATYHFTTNVLPVLSGESPTNSSTGISLTPALYVICTDADSDVMTATWRSNSSGAWVDFATNTSIITGTNITQMNSNFSEYNTTYWWSINLTDGYNWTNETYHFTTNALPTLSGESPSGVDYFSCEASDVELYLDETEYDTDSTVYEKQAEYTVPALALDAEYRVSCWAKPYTAPNPVGVKIYKNGVAITEEEIVTSVGWTPLTWDLSPFTATDTIEVWICGLSSPMNSRVKDFKISGNVTYYNASTGISVTPSLHVIC
ncbi:unnamed protein product, partial [marine sediment metagenome]